MTPDELKNKLRPKRSRKPAREVPDTMTGDELQKLLEPGTLEQQCLDAGLPVPETEVQFHPRRKWRFDYCWRLEMLAVEIDGGTWIPGGGRHNRGEGFLKDMEKLNQAQILGWVVLRFTPDQVKTMVAVNEIAAVLRGRMAP